jgi:hypothetical protein
MASLAGCAKLGGMSLFVALEGLFKWLFVASLLGLAVAYWQRDALPDPDFYDNSISQAPQQTPTRHPPFTVSAGAQHYRIKPLYDYALDGVVVSMHHSDDWLDIYHHQDWGDFINIKDICVIWGDNVRSGVYRLMSFSNSTWTCWVHWPNGEVRRRFRDTELSNNHLLADIPQVQHAILAARPGDQIRLHGLLAEYANPGNGFRRSTSTSRVDRGNGACETIYVQDFDIVRAANPGWRLLFHICLWVSLTTGIGFLALLMITPVRRGLD